MLRYLVPIVPCSSCSHIQSPTTPGQYDLWQNALVPSANWLPPHANWAHLYRALLHQDSMNYYRMHWYLVPIDPSNWAYLYWALLHQDSITYWEMHTYPGQMDLPLSQVYSSLLHQNSITYWQMHTYQGQMDPH